MTRMAIILNQKTHKHIINTTSMATILSQNHTSHIILSTHHHNITISTPTQHHIIKKSLRDSTSHIKEFIIYDTHHLFPKKKKIII